MNMLLRIIYWVDLIFISILTLSMRVPATQEEAIPVMSSPVPDEPLDSEFILRTLIAVLILVVGYFISLGINMLIKRLENVSKVEQKLSAAVDSLIMEMKFQRQKNNQQELEINIIKRRVNAHDNRLNAHEIEIAKIKQQWKN